MLKSPIMYSIGANGRTMGTDRRCPLPFHNFDRGSCSRTFPWHFVSIRRQPKKVGNQNQTQHPSTSRSPPAAVPSRHTLTSLPHLPFADRPPFISSTHQPWSPSQQIYLNIVYRRNKRAYVQCARTKTSTYVNTPARACAHCSSRTASARAPSSPSPDPCRRAAGNASNAAGWRDR